MDAPVAAQSPSKIVASEPAAAPWHSFYPAPRNQAPNPIARSTVLEWFKEGKTPGNDFLLVDLRRVDHEGGTIKGSINLPAQSLYSSIPTLYALSAAAGIREVIFYCGSSRGRGTRAAGWFDDYVSDHGNSKVKSCYLVDGIKGWVLGGEEYVNYMDEYREEAWTTQ